MSSLLNLHKPFWGFIANPTNGTGTQSLNAAATWLAYSFVAQKPSVSLSKVKAFISGVTGTPAASNHTCDLFSDNAGVPNASIEGPINASSAPSASTWSEWTGWTTSLTQGTQYWLVFKNTHGTPASNFFTFRYGSSTSYFAPGNSSSTLALGWHKKHSLDSGGTWGSGLVNDSGGWRLEFNDGTFDGLPFSVTGALGQSLCVFSSNEYGVRVTSPPVQLNVVGVRFDVLRSGTPTGSLQYKIYNPTSLVATTFSLSQAKVQTTGNKIDLLFPSVQNIAANSDLRIVMSETAQSDTSTNRFGTYQYDIENSVASKAMMIGGNAKQTRWDGSTWTDTDTNLTTFALLLDPDQPYTGSAAAGSSMMFGE